MILRGIDRAHDIDLGPSNGTHTRGPVSGGLVQPAPPIPNGRKGAPLPPKPRKPNAHERPMLRPRCSGVLRSGLICRRVASHPGHHKSSQGPIA